jgi:hypothetical protein
VEEEDSQEQKEVEEGIMETAVDPEEWMLEY